MKNNQGAGNLENKSERGTALVTVILVSLLLGTACIALLATVGAGSRNNSDALSEAITPLRAVFRRLSTFFDIASRVQMSTRRRRLTLICQLGSVRVRSLSRLTPNTL